ncbi:MAG: efflux RND transporter periplasmic adaptor subunit [Planctomycetes bacterium]|nr:efflux RND transporter periplasmic adaptor subunit [Planctomycetota bacterium]
MKPPTGSRRGALRRSAPTLIVLTSLALVGYLGHRTGWKVPRPSAIGRGPEAAGEDWCEEHGVPESRCTICRGTTPAPADPRDWCAEHGVPESQCTACHPEIALRGQSAGAEPAAVAVLEAGADGAKGAEGAKGSAVPCGSHLLKVELASEEVLRDAGIALEEVAERPMAEWIAAPAETDYDGTRTARISSRAAGTAWRVEKGLGDAVKAGEVLAVVEAAEAGRARAALVQALAGASVKAQVLERMRGLAGSGLRSQAELQEAEAALRTARLELAGAEQALANLGLPVKAADLAGLADEDLVPRLPLLGLPASLAASLGGGPASANLLPLAAPLDGVVVTRDVVPGEAVEASKTLLVVADTRRLWALIDVRLEDAGRLERGQEVSFVPDGGLEDAVRGAIAWISTALDERTRTVKARAELENPVGRLRAHLFGIARIRVREAPKAVALPEAALHWDGCCHVAFVRASATSFQTRKVRLGSRGHGFVEVVSGVAAGEVVATAGSHVLKSEILKGRLGAGCCAE